MQSVLWARELLQIFRSLEPLSTSTMRSLFTNLRAFTYPLKKKRASRFDLKLTITSSVTSHLPNLNELSEEKVVENLKKWPSLDSSPSQLSRLRRAWRPQGYWPKGTRSSWDPVLRALALLHLRQWRHPQNRRHRPSALSRLQSRPD